MINKILKTIKAFKSILITLLVLGSLIFSGIQQYRINKLAKEAYNSALVIDSLYASNDTLKILKTLSDSNTTYWQKQATQLQDLNDTLEEKLSQQIVVSNTLQLKLDSVSFSDTTNVVTNQDSTLFLHFEKYQKPFTVKSDVTVNTKNKTGVSLFDVKTDPILFNLRIGCKDGPGGIKSADVTIGVPSWVTPEVGQLTQEDDVCNPVKANLGIKGTWDLFPTYFKVGVPVTIGLLTLMIIAR